MGFGYSRRMPSPRPLEFFPDAPVLVEIVAPEDQILALLADAEDILQGKLVTLQPAEVLPASRLTGGALSCFLLSLLYTVRDSGGTSVGSA